MILKFYGASDDLVECEGAITGEIDCNDALVQIKIGDERTAAALFDGPASPFTWLEFEYAAGSAGIKPTGVWSVKAWPLEEDVPMHKASVKLGGRGYSPEVELDVPDATQVLWRRVRKNQPSEWERPS